MRRVIRMRDAPLRAPNAHAGEDCARLRAYIYKKGLKRHGPPPVPASWTHASKGARCVPEGPPPPAASSKCFRSRHFLVTTPYIRGAKDSQRLKKLPEARASRPGNRS